jgi:dihydroxyacid dehydratase/phosphogluconate dehydratase
MRPALNSTWMMSFPYFVKPGGRYLPKDVFEIGGVPVLIKALLDGGYIHGEAMVYTGQTLAEQRKVG